MDFFQETRNVIQSEKKNDFGIRWKLFYFGSLFNNVIVGNFLFSTFYLILEFIIFILMLESTLSDHRNTDETTIFMKDSIFYYLSPSLISTNTWIILTISFASFFDFVFIFLYFYPKYINRVKFLLQPLIHLLIIPIFSSTFSFLFTNYSGFKNSFCFSIYCIIIYPIYLICVGFLYFFYTNSMMNPDKLLQEWFYGSNFYYPFYIAFVSDILFIRRKNVRRKFVLLIICALVSFAYGCFLLLKTPFIMNFVNNFFASEFFLIGIFCILVVFKKEINNTYENLLLGFFPLCFIVIYLFTSRILENKRKSIHQFLSQIDDSFKQFNVKELSTSLSSIIKKQNVIQNVIKEGLLAGNKSITSDVFIQLCFEQFPKCYWFIPLISFLLCVVWEKDYSDVYPILLHLLSLGDIPLFPSYQLYEAIFIMMQTSDEISNIIFEDVNKYRISLHHFAEEHKNFWFAAYRDDEKEFYKALRRLYIAMKYQKDLIHEMLFKYPYCPSVHLHGSLHYADITQDYVKSGKNYLTSVALRTGNNDYVSSSISSKFSSYFPELRIEKKDQDNPDVIQFLSVRSSHEVALRSQPKISLNDTYFETLCNTYSIPMKTAKKKILPFAASKVKIFKIGFIFFIIAYLCFCFLIFFEYNEIKAQSDEYKNRITLIEDTIKFRYQLVATSLDIRLLVNIINNNYSSYLNFYSFSVYYLKTISIALSKYEYKISKSGFLDDNSFIYYFGELYQYILYYTTTNDLAQIIDIVSDNTLDNIVTTLTNTTRNIYQKFLNDQDEWENYQRFDTIKMLMLIVCIVLAIYIFSISFYLLLTNSIEKMLFLILQTVQKIIIKEIAEKFHKLLDFKTYNKDDYPTFRKRNLIYCFTMMSLFSILYPLLTIYFLYSYKSKNLTDLPSLLSITDSIEKIYFSLECSDFKLHKLTNQAISAHFLATSEYDGCIPVDDPYNISVHSFITNFSFFMLIIFFVLFIIEYTKAIEMYKTVQVLLRFIPIPAAESNPILHQLLHGESVDKKDVIKFNNAIFRKIEDPDFFCVVYFDDNDIIYKSDGDIISILECEPKTFWNLSAYIQDRSQTDEKPKLQKFFENRPENDTCCVSLGSFKEIALTFSHKGKVLTIKNDIHHFLTNDKLRKIFTNENIQRRRKESIDECILFAVECDHRNTVIEIASILPIEKFHNFDIFILQSKDQVNIIIRELRSRTQRSAIHYGGPIFIFEEEQNYPALFGKAYDELIVMTYLSNQNDIIASKAFVEEFNMEITNPFNKIKISDTIMEYVNIPKTE